MKVSITTRKRKRCTAVMLDYADLDGKRHQKVVGRATNAAGLELIRRKARAKAKRIELELLEARHQPKIGEETIDQAFVEFHEHMEASNRRPKTKVGYRITMKHFRSFVKTTKTRRLRDVTPRLVIRYIQSREGMAADTVVGEIKRLHCVFQRCIKRGVLTSNAFSHPDVRDVVPRLVKHERCFTDEELAMFLEAALTVTHSPQAQEYHDMFVFLSETGLRLLEGLMQRWCDIHFDQRGGSYLRVEPYVRRSFSRRRYGMSLKTNGLTNLLTSVIRRRRGSAH